LRFEFSRDELDHDTIRNSIEDAELSGIALDAQTLEFTLRQNLERTAAVLGQAPESIDLLEKLAAGVELVYAMPFNLNLRKIQNIQYDLNQRIYPGYRQKADAGEAAAIRWIEYADILNEKLLIQPDPAI
jgi:hypothetical protein